MSEINHRYDTIIWDWNGTLLDDLDLAVGVMNDMLADHQLTKLDKKFYQEIFGFPVQAYYERIGFDLDKYNFDSLSDQFCTTFEIGLSNIDLFPETIPTLSALAEKQHFILSNTQQDTLTRMLSQYDLGHYFQGIYGLDNNLAGGKVALGQRLLEQHNISPERAVLVGDTTHDADVAAQLGCDCVLITTGHNSLEKLSRTQNPVASNLSEVLALLKV